MTDKQWDDLVEPARAALEKLIMEGDTMTDRIEELEAEVKDLQRRIEYLESKDA